MSSTHNNLPLHSHSNRLTSPSRKEKPLQTEHTRIPVPDVDSLQTTPTKRPRLGLLGGGSPKKFKVVHFRENGDPGLTHATKRVDGRGTPRLVGKPPRRSAASPNQDLLHDRRQLPIWSGRKGIVETIRSHDTVIILGETGSGKSTQVPQFLLESGIASNGVIAITQSRKVAATTLAGRVAREQNTSLGGRVGYSVRFDDKISPETRIKYLTDGMVVRELLSDPLLMRYSVVVVDEAHERTLRTDILLANLKIIQKTRNARHSENNLYLPDSSDRPLKVVIMSASLEAERFSRYFNNAKILFVKGRQHPVKIFYTTSPQVDYVDSTLRTFFQIHLDKPPGDVLVFLPGQEDIESLEASIKTQSRLLPPHLTQVLVLPMYAALSAIQQARIFISAPPNTRKCILATNIAETSITVPGVRYVIDSGLCKEKTYQTHERGHGGIEMLLVTPVSKAAALQRAGRAGREGPGLCFRLYTETAFLALKESPSPEIQRCNLTSAILQLKCLGQDPESVEFMDPPNPESIKASVISLFALGALDQTLCMTPLGKEMTTLPMDPPLARALIASKTNLCTYEVLELLSVLSTSSGIFVDSSDHREESFEARKKFYHRSGDHLTLLNIIRAYEEISTAEDKAGTRGWCRKHFLNERSLREALDIRMQLRIACERNSVDWRISCGDGEEPVLKSLWAGFFLNAAILKPDGTYKQTIGPAHIKIHPSSSLCDRKVPMIMYNELVFTSATYCRVVSSVPREWLLDIPFLQKQTV